MLTENARFAALVSLFEKLEAHINQNFTNVVKVAISSMQSLTQDKKISVMKFSPMRAGGKNSLMVKISVYYGS